MNREWRGGEPVRLRPVRAVWAGLVMILLSAPCWAQVYKCTSTQGATLYSALPCGRSAQVIQTPAGSNREAEDSESRYDLNDRYVPRALQGQHAQALQALQSSIEDTRRKYARLEQAARDRSRNQMQDPMLLLELKQIAAARDREIRAIERSMGQSWQQDQRRLQDREQDRQRQRWQRERDRANRY